MEQGLIKRMEQSLQSTGVILIEDMIEMPEYNDSYITSNFAFVLHKKGTLSLTYDLQEISLDTHKAVVLLPNHMLGHYIASPDFERILIIFSPHFFNLLKQRPSFREQLRYHRRPVCSFTDEQWHHIMLTIDLIRSMLHSSKQPNESILISLLDILFQLFNAYSSTNTPIEETSINDIRLFNRFYDLIVAHYRESRNIKYYAESLQFTPKYFARLIREETGISAEEWIDNYVIMQAKHLLYVKRDYTIQQISDELGFSEQSSFCRFFRKCTGVSPTSFRKGS